MVGDEESAGEGAEEAVDPEDVGEVDETEGDGAADYDNQPGEEPGESASSCRLRTSCDPPGL